jgi:hypothetical protein
MEIDRETFRSLPPDRQSLALFDGMTSLPKAVVAEMKEAFVPIDKCIHLGPASKAQPPEPPAAFWLTARQWFFAALTLGALIGGALGLIPAPAVTGQPQPPAITAPQ